MDVLDEYFRENGVVALHDIYITQHDILNKSFTEIINSHKESRAKALFDSIVSWIEPVKGKTVLDVGCGTGYFTFLMAEAGAVATGIECNRTLASVASHIANIKKLDCVVSNSKVENFLPEKDSYDAVLMLNVFDQMLRENEAQAWNTLRRIRERAKCVFIMAGATEQLPNMAGIRTDNPKHMPIQPQKESWEMGHEMIMREGDFGACKRLLRNSYAMRDLWVFY